MSNYDFKTYRLKITVLTPLHIGNGREMLRGYDFAEKHGELWRFNENALLETRNIDDPKIVEQLARAKPAELISDEREYKDGSPLFRYHIPGEVRADQGRVREFIKDVYDQPYLPGSSLKGALRTAIGWAEWGKKHFRPEIAKVSPLTSKNKKYAATRYERDIFGKKPDRDMPGSDPNYDLMRAMQVSDSQPVKPENMQVINVAVYRNWSVERVDRISSLETLPAGLALGGVAIKIDTRLFGIEKEAEQWSKLGFGDPKRLTAWVQVCQQYARQRIETEIEYYTKQAKSSPKISSALNLYRRWQSLQAAENEPAFLLQLGWATGWDGKTFDSRLREDDNFMLKIISGFRLGAHHSTDYRSGDEFPMSRRLPQKSQNAPMDYPLGWVLVNVAEGDADFVETDWQKRILETAAKTETSAPPAAKAPVAPTPKPQPQPITMTFDDVPKVGNRFYGVVLQTGNQVMLEIPGREDTEDYAVIDLSNLAVKRPREGEKLLCEVVAVKQEKNYWRVECRLG